MKPTRLLLALGILFCLASCDPITDPGNTGWNNTRLFGESGKVMCSNAMAVDSTGCIYITGRTSAAIDSAIPYGTYQNIYLTKLNQNGTTAWTRFIPSPAGTSEAKGIAIDSFDNIYITGTPNGALDGIAPPADSVCLFFAKYNPAGERQWIAYYGHPVTTGVTNLTLNGFACNPAGRCYAVGYTNAQSFGGASSGANGMMFYIEIEADGTVRNPLGVASASGSVSGADIKVGTGGTVYVLGYSLDGYIYNNTLNTSGGSFLLTITPGDAIKSPVVTADKYLHVNLSNNSTYATGLAIDDDGNFLVADFRTNSAGYVAAFVTRLSTDTTVTWENPVDLSFGNTIKTYPSKIAADNVGNIFLTGRTNGSLHGETFNGEDSLQYNVMLIRYSSIGTRAFTRLMGTNAGGTFDTDRPALALDAAAGIFLSGYSSGPSFDGLAKLGLKDSFVIKYSANGVKL